MHIFQILHTNSCHPLHRLGWLFLLSKQVHLLSDLCHDVFNFDKYLLNQVEIGMKFYRSKPAFYLMTDLIDPDFRGWSGGAMALYKLPVPGRPTIWMKVGQGPPALAVGACGGCLDIFTLIYSFSPLSSSLGDGPI